MDTVTPAPVDAPLAPPQTFADHVAAEAGAALAEALGATLDKVAEALAEDGPVEMVHEVRKALKDYRALLRLVPGPEAKAARQQAAATARGLSLARDRQAAQDALEALAQAGLLGTPETDAARTLLAEAPEATEGAPDPRRDVADFLDSARASLAGPVSAAARAADVAAGLAKAYARARAKSDFGRAEGVHELRKAVVTHRYQMSFLAAFCGAGGKRARKAQRLRDVLGIHQDLEALRPLLADALGTRHEALMSEVAAASRALQRRLVKTAKAEHKALFARPAEAFAARMQRRMERMPAAPEPVAPPASPDAA